MSTIINDVLDKAGFSESSHLITATSLDSSLPQNRDRIEQRYRYAEILEHQQGPDAIYEIGGIPQIYFKGLNQPTDQQIAALHRFAWNRGDAPLLWVVTPREVRIYNAYSRPTSASNPDAHLIDELQDISQHLEKYRRELFDTGLFWKTDLAGKIHAENRVDQGLLKDIQGTTDQLRKEKLPLNIAHALVGRAIFLAYLRDRNHLPKQFADLSRVFQNKKHAQAAFDWLREEFNGDLFSLSQDEERSLEDSHIETLQRFLSGTDMQTGQLCLWPYRFDVIPIELISSVYEQFAHDVDRDEAKARSVHYTPPFLVHMMLSEAMKNLDSHAVVLDAACGSGVFLVEAFKRLAYRRSVEKGEVIRADELKEILTSQIYGIELSQEAAKITVFSLYLALLGMQADQKDNRRTSGFSQREIARRPTTHRLPPLIDKTVFVADTFNQNAPFNNVSAFRERKFNLIIGNPPWTSWKGNGEIGVEYCRTKNLPVADKKPYQAFIWRMRDFANEATELCMLVHAGMLFLQGDTSEKFRQAFLRECTLRAAINLSDLRKLEIFQKATAPAAILFFSARPPKGDENVTYCCPKWSSSFKYTKQLMLNADDVVSFLVSTAQRFDWIWKVGFWGTARDHALIRKLQQCWSLEIFLQNQNFKVYGRGYEAAGSRTALGLSGKPWLQSGQMRPYRLPSNLPTFPLTHLRRTGREGIYQAPLIVVTRGMRDGKITAAFSQSDLVYSSQYYGIGVPAQPDRYGHYLCSILNSKLVVYFQFLTNSFWGIERSEMKLHDLLRTPIPSLSQVPAALLNDVLRESQWLYEHIDTADQKDIDTHQSALDKLIYQLYGLTPSEQELVEDTLSLTVDFFRKRNRSAALSHPSEADLTGYAEALAGVLNAYLSSIDKRYNVVVFDTPRSSPLGMVKLIYQGGQSQEKSAQVQKIDGLDTVLKGLAPNLQAEIAENLAVRRTLRIYEGTDIYIIQPAERRLWSRSAGRNEADRILREHLESV